MKGMKRNHILFTLLSALLSLGTMSCFSQGAVSVKFLQFREKSDSLHVSYQLKLPSQSVESGQGLRITPVIQAGDSVLWLPHMTVLGKNKDEVLKRYHHNNRMSHISSLISDSLPYNYQVHIPYQLWMDSARLCIRQEVSGYRGRKVITHYQLIEKVELEPRIPYQVVPHVSFIAPQKEEKRRRRQGKAYLDFPVGRSVILPAYRRNPQELQKIEDAVGEVISHQDAELKGLYVEGFASPESRYSLNERLSRGRAIALKEYIRTKFSLDESLFRVSSVAEDWDGLAALVGAGDYPDAEQLLAIINSEQEPDRKEVLLKRFKGGVPYRTLFKDVFPELRRVEYQIDYTVKDYNVEETGKLLDSRPEDLSHLELYTLAQSLDKANPVYATVLTELILRYYSEDVAANNNAAIVFLENGELTTASRYLEKAGDSAQAINNRGVLHLLEGDLDKAEACFERAHQAGSEEAALNKQEVQAKREDNQKMERYTKRR